MKIQRTKGFTLIELMVVISIISLLSTVVIASIKGARDRALVNKTVAEMKSLQNALELYRNAKGFYPQFDVDEDENCNFTCYGSWDNVIQSELVANKYISKIPHGKGYPNNCGSDCYPEGNILGYSFWNATYSSDPNYYYMCDNQKIKSYALLYVTKDNLKLPKYTVYYYGSVYTGVSWNIPGYGMNEYCLSM